MYIDNDQLYQYPENLFSLLVRNASISDTNWVNSSKTITAVTEKEHKHIFEIWLKLHKGVIFKVVRAYIQ